LNRIVLAFRAFFALLFGGTLPEDIVAHLGLAPKAPPPPPPPPPVTYEDGAMQLLGILQREGRILDFFMEDLSPYSDEQIGAAARDVHSKSNEILSRHFAPQPVLDAVEGSAVIAPAGDASLVKFIGNVPASGRAKGGVLRHRGWRASRASLPKLTAKTDLTVIAPAEIEVE
jgi:hypothetical protein